MNYWGGQINKLILAGIFASVVVLPGVAQAEEGIEARPAGIPTEGNKTILLVNNNTYSTETVCWTSEIADKIEGYSIDVIASKIHNVYGVQSFNGSVIYNTVTIKDKSTVADNIYGGYTKVEGTEKHNAENNTVNISNSYVGEIQLNVTGGYSKLGDALINKVNISNSIIRSEASGIICGGYAASGEASNNEVNISEGSDTSAWVYGGHSYNGNANNNIVNITASNTIIVYGGRSYNGNANNNSVNITASSIHGDVIGGYAWISAKEVANTGVNKFSATDNHVYIANASTINGDIYGGDVYISDDGLNAYAEQSTTSKPSITPILANNTLHVSGLNNSAKNIYNFDKFEFDITDAYADKSVMLKLTDADNTEITDAVNVSVSIAGDAKIDNRTISLIAKENKDTTAETGKILGFTKEQEVTLTQGTTLEYKATLKLEEDDKQLNLIIGAGETIGGDEPGGGEPQGTVNNAGKSVVETRAGAGFIVNNMVDFMLSSGMTQAQAAVDDDTCAPFVAVGGNNTRYNTGSHIDVDGWNAIVGFAKQAGNATYGVAVEHGRGDYDSYVGSVHGEGDIKSTGGALFAQVKKDNGVHYDASLRAGKVDTDYKSGTTSYDDDATYYGLTLGAGKELKLTDKAALDLYGRYYFSHLASSDVRLSSGEAVDFDAVDSHRIRLGGRYTSQLNEKSSAYAGVAWQYEFGGDAEAAINGVEAPTPSLQGHSAVLEAGYELQSGKNMSLGFNLTGWLGKQRGIGGTLGAQWTF